MASKYDPSRIHALVLEALETELGGIEVYETAISCVRTPGLREEFTKYLEQTRNHEQVLRSLCEELRIDPDDEAPGRRVVRTIGQALVAAMQEARQAGDDGAAEIVAAECVVLAETKDHLNWELIGELAKQVPRSIAKPLQDAHDEVEEEEDAHLYHSTGWARELWLQSLGLPAVLPPPEEAKDVKTQIAAARARQQRGAML
jgi:hypothetical protein